MMGTDGGVKWFEETLGGLIARATEPCNLSALPGWTLPVNWSAGRRRPDGYFAGVRMTDFRLMGCQAPGTGLTASVAAPAVGISTRPRSVVTNLP